MQVYYISKGFECTANRIADYIEERSALRSAPVTNRKQVPGRHVLLVKLRSGGFGQFNARIAGLARRTKWVSFTDRFPQRRTGAIKKALHPGALASGVVIFAYRFAHRRLRGR
jgi:hypothetical protein